MGDEGLIFPKEKVQIEVKKQKAVVMLLNIDIKKIGIHKKSVLKIQWNPVYTDTKGTYLNVRIIGVSVLSGLFF